MALRTLLLGFLAGAIAVPIFHQLVVLGLYSAGLVPSAPWSFRPTGPYAIPTILNQAFWGGMWGLVFGAIILARPRTSVIVAGLIVGVLGAAMANLTWIPLLRGQPMPVGDLSRWWRPMLILSVWGIGMGIIYAGLRGRIAAR